MLATQVSQLSKATVSSIIERSSGIEVSETLLSSVWRELEYRQCLYSFPIYEIHERSIESQLGKGSRDEYIICLVLSLFGVPGNTQLPGKLFERLTKEAVGKYLNGTVVVFGWPFEKTDDDDETRISKKVKQLANELRERFYETPASRFKDRGLDIVGWIPHADKRSSQLVVLLQCAAGHNWVDKTPVPMNAWRQYIHWAANPIQAFAVPCIISEQKWHEISTDKGILFDRIRIMNLLSNGIMDMDLKNDISKWVKHELENHVQ
jgi:hypothetical protein